METVCGPDAVQECRSTASAAITGFQGGRALVLRSERLSIVVGTA